LLIISERNVAMVITIFPHATSACEKDAVLSHEFKITIIKMLILYIKW